MFFRMAFRSLLLLVLLGFCGAVRADETVDINTADVATLDRVLLNIGPAKAAAIVAFREANGPFKRIEDLGEVKGIGDKTLEKNRSRITLSAKVARVTSAEWKHVPR